MSRIRSIKPEFFTSERIAALSDAAKITFIGLWTEADDYGVAPAHPRVLKGHLWPMADHVSPADIERHLDELASGDPLIERYAVDGKPYLFIRGWAEHQRVAKPSQRRLPRPDGDTPEPSGESREPYRNPPGVLPEGSGSGVSTGEPVENGLPEECAEEKEVEREVEKERGVGTSLSSSGLVQQGLSTGHDEDDEIDLTDPPPDPQDRSDEENPATSADPVIRRAWEAAVVGGKADMRRAARSGQVIDSAVRYWLGCARGRWALDSDRLIEAAQAHPELKPSELLAHIGAMAAHPAGGHQPPGVTPPAPQRPACGTCGQPAHHGVCPWDGMTRAEVDVELEAIRRELEERGDQP